ncbi:Bacterial 2-isopropylmalate synthase [Candidatus Omnitrophus magneticus]|uniref:2-isopropylmalate synthase n=1 Tax=Candidatus Omnitrophus magneticus TaxID=1609969 RepID=A0A0F0CLG2_9BACT|nr:Bacterial 2-isopropylmalate synthase [Candidatus Omnitrophus magneticus]
MSKEKILILDTTLRDGEQTPGANLTVNEKLKIAVQLETLGVDIIEAGFPHASPGDLEAVSLIAKEVRQPIICGLARATEKDIDSVFLALKNAERARVHVFLATSKIHREFKLHKAKDEILETAVRAVRYAKNKFYDVEFSPEDAARTEVDFLAKVVEAVIAAGANTVNIPDTVGYSTPEEFGAIIKYLKENVANIDKAVISVHCHNDLGLGVSNSLSAILNGARQVECTINGLGERAGNSALEEIVMSIKTRNDIFKGVDININTKELFKTSRLVSKLTGILVQPNKAIIGDNAFRHESGIHQDGVLKKPVTYEIIKPEDVGFKGTTIVLGKLSGRHAFSEKLKTLGYSLSTDELNEAFIRFKNLADKKSEIYDEDLAAIVEEKLSTIPEKYRLEMFQVTSGNTIAPVADVIIIKDGKEKLSANSTGDGPIDACFKTIDKAVGCKGVLIDYKVNALTSGKDALGEASVKVSFENNIVIGRASSTDVIEASVLAYVNALNRFAQTHNTKK